ncbi:MAG: holo-ACP synthase [Epsilonproteobacteria bacterium]|nr:MAG: holo-ACP synthase [Campylobacteraceae bacterium 4484_166]RLA74186.1 MAG: holo-ACP synthase [Campylobacterota bacterium]
MIGIDIIKISRIEKFIEKNQKKALDKFLSPKEIKLSKSSISTIAGFWCAKEAASKALGTGIGSICGFKDIKLNKTKRGQPTIKYKKHIRKKFNIKHSNISISHDSGFVIAVVANA